MPTTNFPSTIGSVIKYQYVNPDIPAGNTITSNLVLNSKTYFSSSPTIPESSASLGGIAAIQAAGVLNTGITALSLTITIEMQGVIVASITQLASANLVNTAWNMQIKATILANGSIEVQGDGLIAGTPMIIKNSTSFNMSTVNGVPVTVSAQWGTLSLGGSIQLRQLILQVT